MALMVRPVSPSVAREVGPVPEVFGCSAIAIPIPLSGRSLASKSCEVVRLLKSHGCLAAALVSAAGAAVAGGGFGWRGGGGGGRGAPAAAPGAAAPAAGRARGARS